MKRVNRKSILGILVIIGVLVAMLGPALPVSAGTGYSPITVWLGTNSYTVTANDYATLFAADNVTITGTYNTSPSHSFSYTGVPVYKIMEFAFPAVSSLTGYSVLTADNTDYKVIVGPNVIDNTVVKGNDNLIIATSGTLDGVAGTNFPRLACSTFTAGNRFNNNVATMRLQYVIQAPTPTNGTVTPATGWYSGSNNPWTNSTPPALGVDYGGSSTFNFTPASGYHVATLTVDGGAVAPAASYNFNSVTANHTLSATFSNITLNVYIDPSSQAVTNGAPFTVNLAINTNQHVGGWQVNVDFDASKMQYTGATEGNFLKNYATSDNAATGFCIIAPTIDNVNGHVTNLTCAIFGGTLKGGATGSGTLCTLAFTANPGVNNYASITPSSVVISDNSGNTIPGTTVTGGTVAIGNVPMPDLVVSALSAAKVSDTTYTITYTVTNQGNLGAGACSTSIVIDGGAPITLGCPALAGGASDTETTAAQTISGSSDTILVTADSANVVAESNEGNNTRQITYALVGGSGTTIVNGNIAANLQLTVPGTIDPWNLVVGSNDLTGTLNVMCNTAWQVQVNDQNSTTAGHMTKWLLSNGYDPSVKLTAPLTVGCTTSVDLSGTPQTIVTGLTSGQSGNSGQNCTISFHQPVLYADPVLGGGYSYHIVVTFTASSTF